jgi:hypothetical protein
MGVSASNAAKAANAQKIQQTEPAVKGHWVSDIKTGFRWSTDPIISGPDVVKKPLGSGGIPQFEDDNNVKIGFSLPNLPGEVWGPYRKTFTKSDIMPGQAFTPPESVDGVPILCRCRMIYQYMRDDKGGRMLQGLGAVLGGKSVPACWDDSESIWNPTGGMYFYVKTRHPDFYTLAASKQGLFGVAKAVATGPVGPVPLALGAYFLSRPKSSGGGNPTRRLGKKAKAKTKAKATKNTRNTRKMKGLKSKRH